MSSTRAPKIPEARTRANRFRLLAAAVPLASTGVALLLLKNSATPTGQAPEAGGAPRVLLIVEVLRD